MAMEVLGGSCPSGFISCGRDSRRAVGVLAAREIRSIIAIAITAKMAAKTSTAMWGSALAASPMLRHLNAVHHHHHPPVGYSICSSSSPLGQEEEGGGGDDEEHLEPSLGASPKGVHQEMV